MLKFSLETTDRLFAETGSEVDQMGQDVREEAEKEYGSMDQLAFDRKTSAMPELNVIPDDAALGFNVYPTMDSYVDSMVDENETETVE